MAWMSAKIVYSPVVEEEMAQVQSMPASMHSQQDVASQHLRPPVHTQTKTSQVLS